MFCFSTGYTFQQGSFQNYDNSSTNLSLEQGSENRNTQIPNIEGPKQKRQGLQAVCRDLVGKDISTPPLLRLGLALK